METPQEALLQAILALEPLNKPHAALVAKGFQLTAGSCRAKSLKNPANFALSFQAALN
jgi:hypothetical protein